VTTLQIVGADIGRAAWNWERGPNTLWVRSMPATQLNSRYYAKKGWIIMERLEEDISFIQEVDKLKNIVRKSRNTSNERFENDAEHSWHICIMAITLQKYSNVQIDISRVLHMLIIHDLGEIYSGDTIVYAKGNDLKRDELESASKLFSMLGPIQQKELYALLVEFETRETPEAKYANAIDRTEPILQNIHRNGETWNTNRISYKRIVELNQNRIAEGSKELWGFLLQRINQMKTNHIIE
jgi:putative hydrolase of HD superfamily